MTANKEGDGDGFRRRDGDEWGGDRDRVDGKLTETGSKRGLGTN